MKRTLVSPNPDLFPENLRPLISGSKVYDSSCSNNARVWFIDREDGFYLKRSAPGVLKKEADLTRYFNGKGLAPEVVSYTSSDFDWLLTTRVPGEDCTHPDYLSDPKRLCDTTAELLRALHALPVSGCPIDRTADYLAAAAQGRSAGRWDRHLFSGDWDFPSPDAAWQTMERYRHLLADRKSVV